MIKIGRVRFWFATKQKKCYARGFCGRTYVLRIYRNDIMSSGTWTEFATKKAKQMAIKKGECRDFFGFTTYWFWRFFLSIHTKSYYAQNG